jgi:hypothetical protein
MLEDEGLILRSPGLGTFVQDTKSGATRESLFGIAFPEMGHGEIFDPIASSIAGLGSGELQPALGYDKGKAADFLRGELSGPVSGIHRQRGGRGVFRSS